MNTSNVVVPSSETLAERSAKTKAANLFLVLDDYAGSAYVAYDIFIGAPTGTIPEGISVRPIYAAATPAQVGTQMLSVKEALESHAAEANMVIPGPAELLRKLQILQVQALSGVELETGICGQVDVAHLPLLESLIAQWPGHSGYDRYPVPGHRSWRNSHLELTPLELAEFCYEEGPKWSEAYGVSRMNLLDWLIDVLAEECQEEMFPG